MNREEVSQIVREAREEEKKPDLTGADLKWADLKWVDLKWADLTGADLRWAKLTGADLTGADLKWVDLRGANLRGAYLSGANLRGAYLRGAYLRGADLSGANLRGAYLSGADLSGASGTFSSFYGGRHNGIAVGGYISIGCERHTYQEWLDHGVEIGKQNEYTDAEIKHYMDWIVSAIEWLSVEEESLQREETEP